jgi:hypothetical protein
LIHIIISRIGARVERTKKESLLEMRFGVLIVFASGVFAVDANVGPRPGSGLGSEADSMQAHGRGTSISQKAREQSILTNKAMTIDGIS